jgi:predicted nucleic acid-binding protein
MSSVYLDACYLAKLLIEEPDSRKIADLVAAHDIVACSVHGRAEVATTLHRKLQEGAITRAEHDRGAECLMALVGRGQVRWLPLVDSIFAVIERTYAQSDVKLHLRSADALHLACAVEHGFGTVWSSDRQMQSGARAFGIECKAAGV